jgi:hypothetical protein
VFWGDTVPVLQPRGLLGGHATIISTIPQLLITQSSIITIEASSHYNMADTVGLLYEATAKVGPLGHAVRRTALASSEKVQSSASLDGSNVSINYFS